MDAWHQAEGGYKLRVTTHDTEYSPARDEMGWDETRRETIRNETKRNGTGRNGTERNGMDGHVNVDELLSSRRAAGMENRKPDKSYKAPAM